MAEPRSVYTSPHFDIALFDDAAIVRVTRLARTFNSEQEVQDEFTPMLTRLDVIGRRGRALLMDSRLAIANNAVSYEIWMAPYRRELIIGFAYAVFVLKTSVGQLQTRRLLKGDDPDQTSQVFTDYDEALQFLLERRHELRPFAKPSKFP
jgi:hypothetical protein